MTLSSLQNGNEVLEKPAEKTKIRPKKNYSQLDNDLFDLSLTGTKDTPAAAFQTLCFILRLHPDTIVTPKNISLQWELRAIKNNGKLKKESTIRHEFRQLCNAGYMTRSFNKDSKGGSMPTQYAINYEKIYNRGVENSTPINLDINSKESFKNHNKIRDVENSTTPLYKEHANNNTGNTTSVAGNSVTTVKKSASPIGADFFVKFPQLKKTRENWSMIRSLIKYHGDNAMKIAENAFSDEIKSFRGYIWKAINNVKYDTEKPESLKKETSNENPPPNPQEKQASQQEIKAKEIEKKDAFNEAWEERKKSDVVLSEKEERYSKYLGCLTIDEKIKLIESIIPTLTDFTRKRLHLERGIDADNIDFYFNNGQIKSFVMEGKIDG